MTRRHLVDSVTCESNQDSVNDGKIDAFLIFYLIVLVSLQINSKTYLIFFLVFIHIVSFQINWKTYLYYFFCWFSYIYRFEEEVE